MQLETESVFYDNTQSTLIFSESNNLQQLDFDPDYPNIKTINLNFIKKNESTYSHYKYL